MNDTGHVDDPSYSLYIVILVITWQTCLCYLNKEPMVMYVMRWIILNKSTLDTYYT
jgi:hypothetical protein